MRQFEGSCNEAFLFIPAPICARYLVLQRVERAKALLTLSNCALAEVAQQSGFCDQALFSRTFKAVVGTTPGQWRRQNSVPKDITLP